MAESQKYSPQRIAHELMETAQGNSYYGSALYAAKDLPILNDDERWVIQRWLSGFQCASDVFKLQEIAMTISCDA